MAQIKMGRWVTLSGQGQSNGLELGSDTLVGVYTPADLDAAQFRLQASVDGATYADMVDAGTPIQFPADVSSYVVLDPTKLLGARFVRVAHLDGSGSAVNETADRELLPVFRAFE